jgi:hypothetical protein
MLGPQLLEIKPKGEGFKQKMVELDLASGALRAALPEPPPSADGSRPVRRAKKLVVNCAYGATFQEPPAKYAAMHVLALQEPGQLVHFLRFENAEDKAQWATAIEGTMVSWPALTPLSFEFMSGPGAAEGLPPALGPEPEPEPEQRPSGGSRSGNRGGSVELTEPSETESPITAEDFDAARSVVDRFELLDSLSQIPSQPGHPSGFRLLNKTQHIALYKSKERATKHFLYRPSALSCRGIPARFVQDVMRDDTFAVASNPHCTEFADLGRNSGGNEITYQLVELSSFKSKPRELLTMRDRRRREESSGNGGVEETMVRSTYHPDRPVEHPQGDRASNPSGEPQRAVRAYQFLYSHVAPADAAAAASGSESCAVVGLLRVQPRGDCPRQAIDSVATTVMTDVWARVREEAIVRMQAEGLPAPPEIAADPAERLAALSAGLA